MGATGHSYLRSLLPLWLTMPSYFSTSSVVLAVRCALCPLQFTPAVVSNRVEMGNDWVEGAPESNSVGWLRVCWNSDQGSASFVPEIFIAFMAYHAVILLHTICGPCSEVRVLPAAVVTCRPYSCQVGHTIAGSSMPVSGQLHCGESAMLEI
ncbi:hypothetical protein B296_00007277 [Ensete ventricosum]|uniref:Secreted protein n=1 Tax=Ensete ventricosum TaxID=4639 RepID=A0A427A7T1_ENSVE|nr:hypothetical protein B296_00007277 [Ensete ventricosum]